MPMRPITKLFSGRSSHKLAHAVVSLWAACLLVTPIVTSAQEAPWQLEMEQQNIRVFSREVAGSPFLAVKAISHIDAPISAVIAQLGDGNGCVAWRSMCKSSRIIEQVSDNERYVYVVLDLPWPVSDRDMVIYSNATEDKSQSKVSVSFESVSDRYPHQDLVRAESNASYIIAAVGKDQVEFTYILHTDLGGMIPADRFNSKLLDSTLEDMQRLLELLES